MTLLDMYGEALKHDPSGAKIDRSARARPNTRSDAVGVDELLYSAIPGQEIRRGGGLPGAVWTGDDKYVGHVASLPAGGALAARTPAAVVARLADATKRALDDADVRSRIEAMFLEVEYLAGPEVRGQFELRAAQFGPLIKRLNIKTQ